MKLGIDIGGTFTDLVLLDEATGNMHFGKTLTTYPDPTIGILQGVEEVMHNHQKKMSDVQSIVHGTTLVTNAVIERKGAKTAFITTKGFEDVLEIGREMRYDIYDLFLTMPKPLVPQNLRKGITERLDKNGNVLTAIDMNEVAAVVADLVAEDVQSIAVTFLHSFANKQHEQMVGQFIKEKYPHIYCSLSCEVMPEIREYERSSATAMNAYVQPLVSNYLSNLMQRLQALKFNGHLHIMNSSGRLTTVEGAAHTPIQLLESGPAGGTMATVFFGKLVGKADLLAFDMGGTTAKASMIRNNEPEITNQFEAAREKRFKKGSGLPVRIPVIDMIEIGAGGGSIAHINHLGLLTVGPESAASNPGPACYGRGGTRPTVTDADLVLGYLNADYFLGGTMQLRKDLAEQAIFEHIAKPLKVSVEEAAWGIHRIVNENMANAARVHILEKGLDPRKFSMMAFGGAGPVHAFNVARLMHAPQLIVPSGAGVLSALGFLVSPIASEEITSYVCRLDKMDWAKVNGFINDMKEKGFAFLASAKLEKENASVSIVADMRYAGQGHEITVRMPNQTLSAESLSIIEQNFIEEYHLRYGRTINNMPIETVTWRLLVSGPTPTLTPKQAVLGVQEKALKGKRNLYFGSGFVDAPVYNRYAMDANETIAGPCIIEEMESTTVIGPNSSVRVDAYKNIIIDLH
jgi:N-methylhydantoinase A